MTRLDTDATEETLGAEVCDGPRARLLEAREVPLGGIRAMTVRRLLPQRDLPMVGAWCFLDRFGPQETRMRVEPHPHTGLQTVTWPFGGDVHHRDSIGSDVVVRPGVLNLMTSGAGIAHSEYSVTDEPVLLDALQLWVALPEQARWGPAGFEQHADLPVVRLESTDSDGRGAGEATVVLGELADVRSPATAYTPIVGAELRLDGGRAARVPVNPEWEYALVGVDGRVTASGAGEPDATSVGPDELLSLGRGRSELVLQAEESATAFLLGGEPFASDIVMWWNFVGRSHDEIVAAREEWEAGSARFGRVDGHGETRIPAPPMPHVTLRPRRRRM